MIATKLTSFSIKRHFIQPTNNMILGKKIWLLTILLSICTASFAQTEVKNPDPQRYKDEINNFKTWDAKNSFPKHAILFVGSSSIRFWESHDAFPTFPIINRGFGGSHISDVRYYYDEVIGKYDPSVIVFYCGDNDIAAGKSVEQVFGDYTNLTARILHDFPTVKFIYLPIKPSSSRWNFWSRMNELNLRIKTYNQQNKHLFYVDTATLLLGSNGRPNDSLFRPDHLHLNPKGYAIWNRLLQPELKSLYKGD
ncbi:MAG: GDSL-type esterase/lipase family protein [Limisphaerales bacterium]